MRGVVAFGLASTSTGMGGESSVTGRGRCGDGVFVEMGMPSGVDYVF